MVWETQSQACPVKNSFLTTSLKEIQGMERIQKKIGFSKGLRGEYGDKPVCVGGNWEQRKKGSHSNFKHLYLHA